MERGYRGIDRVREEIDEFILKARRHIMRYVKAWYRRWREEHSLARVEYVEEEEYGGQRITLLSIIKSVLNWLYKMWRASHPYRIIVGIPIIFGGMWGLPGSQETDLKIQEKLDSFFTNLTGRMDVGHALSLFFSINAMIIWFFGEKIWFNSWMYLFSRSYRKKLREEAAHGGGDPFAKVYGNFVFILLLTIGVSLAMVLL